MTRRIYNEVNYKYSMCSSAHCTTNHKWLYENLREDGELGLVHILATELAPHGPGYGLLEHIQRGSGVWVSESERTEIRYGRVKTLKRVTPHMNRLRLAFTMLDYS